MNYLDPTEYGSFGLGAATPDELVAAASAVIDAHCRRPTLGASEYVERMRFRGRRRTVQLSNTPLLPQAETGSPLVSVRVRWGGTDAGMAMIALGDVAQVFGLCGSWSVLNPATVSVAADGLVEFTPGLLPVRFDEAEITYWAGYATVPNAVKLACAQVVRNAQATPALNVRDSRMDMLRLQYFSASLLDADTTAMLRPYVSQRVS